MEYISSIFNLLALPMLMLTFMMTVNLNNAYQKDYDTERLSIALDYATEAAFLDATKNGDIDVNYENLYSIKLNPTTTIKVLESLICLNYDMSTSVENMQHVEDYIPVALIACNDGYYVTCNDKTIITGDAESYPLRWTLKKPYTITIYNNNSDDLSQAEKEASGIKGVYSCHLDDRGGILLKAGENTLTYFNDYNTDSGLDGYPISDTLVREAVSKSINDAITYAIEDKASDMGGVSYKFYLPTENGRSGINSIQYPSFLMIMNKPDFAGKADLKEASLGGYRVTRRTKVLCYTRNINGKARKLYCYESQMPEEVKTALKIEFVNSVREAAEAGYTPDYEFIFNKINTDMGMDSIPHA